MRGIDEVIIIKKKKSDIRGIRYEIFTTCRQSKGRKDWGGDFDTVNGRRDLRVDLASEIEARL